MKKQINKLVLVTRRDLSPGYQACQPLHALAEFAQQHPSQFFFWQVNEKNIVLLTVSNEQELKNLYEKIEGKKSQFQEPDIKDEWTAICFSPVENDCRLTSTLPLALKEIREEPAMAST